MTEHKRNKASVEAAGFSMNELAKLHAIKSNRAKQFNNACESVEYFWQRVFDKLDEQEERETA